MTRRLQTTVSMCAILGLLLTSEFMIRAGGACRIVGVIDLAVGAVLTLVFIAEGDSK